MRQRSCERLREVSWHGFLDSQGNGMTTVRVCADGLALAARQLGFRSDAIAAHRAPRMPKAADQGTAAVTSAITAQVNAISAVLADRIEATAAKFADAGRRYLAADSGPSLADRP